LFRDDIEDEGELDDIEMFPSSIPRPEPELKPMSLDDLMESGERNNAILFLSLDEIMEGIVQQYKAVIGKIITIILKSIIHSRTLWKC
jgi:hypothetical protein